jgi:RNA polymerase sigma-B factor
MREDRAHARGRGPVARSTTRDDWELGAAEPPAPGMLAEWIERYKLDGCRDARDRVVGSHLRLVAREARRFANTAAPFDDLMVEGSIALMRALENFDLSRGVPFTAYAAAVVDHTLRGVAARAHELVSVPAAERKRIQKSARAEPTGADATPVPVRMLSARRGYDTVDVVELIDEHAAPDLRLEQDDEVKLLVDAIKTLQPAARRLLAMRFGVLGERQHSATELRDELGLGRQQLQQAMTRATGALRLVMNSRRNQAEMDEQGFSALSAHRQTREPS